MPPVEELEREGCNDSVMLLPGPEIDGREVINRFHTNLVFWGLDTIGLGLYSTRTQQHNVHQVE